MNRPSLCRIYRILGIVKERKNISSKGLADDLEVNEKTILRDFELLKYQMGVPLEYDKRKKTWYLKEDFDYSRLPLPAIDLNDDDFKSLILGFDILNFLKPYPGESKITRSIEILQEKIKSHFQDKINFISFDMGKIVLAEDEKKVRNHIKILEICVRNKKQISFQYYSPNNNERKKRKNIFPLHLHSNMGRWFLLGYDQEKHDRRLFCLDRMEELIDMQEIFRYAGPKDFENYCRKSFRHQLGPAFQVKVKFDEYQSRWIRTQKWFSGQRIKELGNGEIEMIFKFSGAEDFKRWILKYGTHAEVLSPAWLRDEIKKEIEAMEKNYSPSLVRRG